MQLKKTTEKIIREHAAVLVFQFGSTVTGFEHPSSDVDLGVVFSSFPEPKEIAKVYADLESAFSSEFPGKRIDLVFLREAPLSLQYRATQEGILLYSNTAEDYANYLEHVLKYYFDFKPVERELQLAQYQAISA